MKQYLLYGFCVLQLLQGTPAFAGDSDQIAKYTGYGDLNISGRHFNPSQIRQFYASRGYRPVWFMSGSPNFKLDIYVDYASRAYDLDRANQQIWLPTLEQYMDGAGETWITTELVGTYSLITYLSSRGVTDFSALNRALEGDGYDLQYYLKNLRQRADSTAAPTNAGNRQDRRGGGILGGLFGPWGRDDEDDQQNQQSQGPILDPASPIAGNAAAVPVGVSNARYANDPTAADVNALYQGMNQSFWIDSSYRPNQMAQALRELLRDASSQGLNPDDYWDSSMDSLYSSGGPNFENRASLSFLRFVTHLSRGRLDPKAVDGKLLQFQMKKFDDMKSLSAILLGSAGNLRTSVLALAPQLPQYQKLVQTLQRLTVIRDNGLWKKISDPGRALKMGENSAIVGAIRTRFDQLGYPGVGSGNQYDQQFAAALKLYLSSNSLPGTIDYRFWNNLGKGVDDRIQQIKINLEKLRWIPRDARTRYAFVNLAAQEIRLMDNGQQMMKFRTVNGRADRPTPSMMQQIRSVILNPTWTVPPKLAFADEMPQIQKDPNFLKTHNMYILDTYTKQYYNDLSQIDMTKFTDNSATTRYYFVQGPGNLNALGVIKFPLSNMDGTINADDIYLHDTNQRDFFTLAERYKSSGCIRLQMPIEFGEQVLKDKGITADQIRAKVPWDNPAQIVPQNETNQVISLPKSLPVYILYLTAEQIDEGGARLLEDTYGLDAKILAALKASI